MSRLYITLRLFTTSLESSPGNDLRHGLSQLCRWFSAAHERQEGNRAIWPKAQLSFSDNGRIWTVQFYLNVRICTNRMHPHAHPCYCFLFCLCRPWSKPKSFPLMSKQGTVVYWHPCAGNWCLQDVSGEVWVEWGSPSLNSPHPLMVKNEGDN